MLQWDKSIKDGFELSDYLEPRYVLEVLELSDRLEGWHGTITRPHSKEPYVVVRTSIGGANITITIGKDKRYMDTVNSRWSRGPVGYVRISANGSIVGDIDQIREMDLAAQIGHAVWQHEVKVYNEKNQ